ncbi:MAG: hypothetical protein SFZ23_07440 [Planctomycetota bacterium]|nr:hypothetical protein [Planctomycetota bacterium]
MPTTPSDPDTDAVLDEIVEAFRSVNRVGGRSWTDAMALDLMGVPRVDFPIAHREDDQSWIDVANDGGWDPYRGVGGWPFLDGVGFRYYLAAAMYRAVQTGESGDLARQMDLPSNAKAQCRFLGRWVLDARQQRVVEKVANLMRARALAADDASGFDEWDRVVQGWSAHASQ